MKRALFETVKVVPYGEEPAAVDRRGYESAVLALKIESSKTAVVNVKTADTAEGPFEAVGDSRLFIDNPVNESGDAKVENTTGAETVANLDIDLIGCKQFVQITVTDGTPFALALGDATDCPVK